MSASYWNLKLMLKNNSITECKEFANLNKIEI